MIMLKLKLESHSTSYKIIAPYIGPNLKPMNSNIKMALIIEDKSWHSMASPYDPEFASQLGFPPKCLPLAPVKEKLIIEYFWEKKGPLIFLL